GHGFCRGGKAIPILLSIHSENTDAKQRYQNQNRTRREQELRRTGNISREQIGERQGCTLTCESRFHCRHSTGDDQQYDHQHIRRESTQHAKAGCLVLVLDLDSAQPFALPVGLFGELESGFVLKTPFPCSRKGLFVTKDTFQFPEKAYWEREWLGNWKVSLGTKSPFLLHGKGFLFPKTLSSSPKRPTGSANGKC